MAISEVSHRIFHFRRCELRRGIDTIGDPPLFLGYLRGVPFFWVLGALWYKWLIATAILLGIFYWIDARKYRRHKEFERVGAEQEDIFSLLGKWNLLFLAAIVGAAFVQKPIFLREALMIGAAVASYFTTSNHVHERNHFSFHPVREVAILFAAIFAAMMPALDWLSQHAGELGIVSTTQFYWLTGGLSSVLDNAPTYLNFLSTGMGLHGLDVNSVSDVGRFAGEHGDLLRTISVAAVFFGAMTYIGNGPNFMCKAIAESAKLPTPTFAEYIWKYAIPFLLPVLIVTWFLVY